MDIFGNIKVIVTTAVAVALFFGGYLFGARRVNALEEQIKTIKNEANDAKAQLKKTQDDVASTLAAQAAEFKKQNQQIQAEADQQKKQLTAALGEANNRIKSLQDQMSRLDSRRAQLVKQMNEASAADRKNLQDQIDKLDQEKQVLAAQSEANRCLAIPVPNEVIGSLVKRG
jgi:DNA anti-recombination protein RmuC